MRFPIQDIELHYEDELVEKGELLIQRLGISGLKEIEKNLWVGQTQEGFEPEVQLKGKKVKAISCDCGVYQKNGICAHLLATLLLVREQLKTRVKEKVKPPREGPRRLTTAGILDRVPTDELKSFIAEYARHNRQFSLAFKARFAGVISEMANEDKYRQLLNTAIKSVSRPSKTIKQTGVKQLAKIVSEIQARATEAIELQHFQEAFDILQIISSSASEILIHIEGDKSDYLAMVKTNFQIFHNLIQSPLAPDLEEDIWHFLYEAFDNRQLRKYQLHHYFLLLLYRMAKDTHRQIALLENIDRDLDSPRKETPDTPLLLTKLDLLRKLERKEEQETLLNTHLSEPSVLLKAIDLAKANQNFERVRQLAQMGLEKWQEKDQQHQLIDILLQTALAQDNQKEVIAYATQKLQNSLQIEDYLFLKKMQEDEWTAAQAKVVSTLRALPFSIEKRDILAEIFVAESQWAKLMDYLEEVGSLDLIMQFDSYLVDQYPDRLYPLYENLLLTFLNQHLGRQTSVRVKKIILHLQKTGAVRQAKSLVRKLRQEYTDRHSLIEELAEL